MLPGPQIERVLVRRFLSGSRALAVGVALLGAALTIMRQPSGVGFAALGLALYFARARALALGALFVGVFLVWRNPDEPLGAVDLILAGAAILFLTTRFVRVAQIVAGACAFVALVGLFAHAYHVRWAFGVTAYTRMSLAEVAGFLAVTLSAWLARPQDGFMRLVTSDGAAGFAARRLYPAVILLPLFLGGATVAGAEARWFNGKLGLSVLVLASIVVLMVVVTLFSGALDKSDHARLRLAAVLLEESERRHLARELHDEIGQSLTALKLRLEMVGGDASLGADHNVKAAQSLAEELMARVSSLSLDLRPAMLDDLGLLPALLWLFDRFLAQTNIVVEFVPDGLDGPRLPRERETAAFRIVQEGLSNAARHSGAKRVVVRVLRREDRLSVQVEDAGRGFDPDRVMAAPSTGGLIGMRERAVALGGRFTIDASLGHGTRLCAELPVSGQ